MKLDRDGARSILGSGDSPVSVRREFGRGRGRGTTFALRTGFAARFFIAQKVPPRESQREHSARRATDQRVG
jgi:hypothetical protein